MRVLAITCGSSSLKLRLSEMSANSEGTEERLAWRGATELGSESFAQKADHEPLGELLVIEATFGKHREAGEARQRVRQRRYSSNG